jgi:hypothetical protein
MLYEGSSILLTTIFPERSAYGKAGRPGNSGDIIIVRASRQAVSHS